MREGWERKKLGELSKIMYGHTAKSTHNSSGPKYLRITDVQNGIVDWSSVPHCEESEDLVKYMLKEGDIVFARTGATTGKSYLITECPNAVFASYLIRLQLQARIMLPNFLYHFFQSERYWNEISDGISGSAQGGFNASKLADLQVPVPPHPEQQRIVSILDEAFAAIDKAKANVQKNLANAKELFQSELNAIFSQKGEGWVEKKLGEICEFKGGGTPSTKVEAYWKGDLPWVSPKDMKSEIISDSQDHISLSAVAESAASLIPEGSILIVVRSGILVHTVPLGITSKALTINQDLKAIIPGKGLQSEFLFYQMRSKSSDLLSKVTRGATVHRLTTDSIRETMIIVPSLMEQQNLTSKVKAFKAKTENLQRIYYRQLNDLDELRKSVLQKAFTGELVTKKEIVEKI